MTKELLTAWRLGIKFGSTIDRHGGARWHLQESGRAAVPNALGFELGALLDYEASAELANRLGIQLTGIGNADQCRTLFYRQAKLTPEDVTWFQEFVASTEKHFEDTYEHLKTELNKRTDKAASIFEFAVHAGFSPMSNEARTKLPSLASAAGIGSEETASYFDAITDGQQPDELRKELARLDKNVERWLIDASE